MHGVSEVNFGVACQTRVWMSEKANKGYRKFQKRNDPNGAVEACLKRCAVMGFRRAEYGDFVKHEWDGVYRFGRPDSLFRLIGFYEDDTKENFIVIDAFEKGKQRLNARERGLIDNVAAVKRNRDWEKVLDEPFPRLVKEPR